MSVELPPAVAGPAFLPDGTEVWVRPVQPSDRELVREFLDQESAASLDARYFTALPPALPQGDAARAMSPDDSLCLLVLGDRSDRVAMLGVGEYARACPGASVAEVAFLVATPFRGRGIATLLLARLARAARAYGILRFEARFAAESPEMLEVFRGSPTPVHEAPEKDEVDVLIPLSPEAGSGEPQRAAEGTTGVTTAGSQSPGSGPSRPRPSGLRSRA